MYVHNTTVDGWPLLMNAKGMHLYHDKPKDMWCLNAKYFEPACTCTAHIDAKEGPLPVGAHIWQLSPACLGKPADSDWEGRTLTVTLVSCEELKKQEKRKAAKALALVQKVRPAGCSSLRRGRGTIVLGEVITSGSVTTWD